MWQYELSNKALKIAGLSIFAILCCLPIFIDFPFTANIYLTYEGAYRMYLGQIPFRDFGTSVGPGMWLLPALFFKIFGPFFSSLIKAQVFINIISGICLRGLLKKLNISEAIILITLILFYSTYVLTHFWPWYNHSVFFYQIIALFLLVSSFYNSDRYQTLVLLFLASFFTLISFLTKQDGGGFTFLICNALLIFVSFKRMNFKYILFYNIVLVALSTIFIFVFKPFDLFYWFNLGQYPHISRLYFTDILHDLLDKSLLMKFFLFSILLVLLNEFVRHKSLKDFFSDKNEKYILFIIITFTIVFESTIIQVTSYFPHVTINYFYAFGMVFILNELKKKRFFDPGQLIYLLFCLAAITIIWSKYYWFYGQKVFPSLSVNSKEETAISKYNQYNTKEDTLKKAPQTQWIKTGLKSTDNIKFPEEGKKGILKLVQLSKQYNKEIRVLNMSQLTFLAYEMNFTPEASSRQPLWYHRGVNVFDREVEFLCEQVQKQEYDIIIFQDIPKLRDYFPHDVFNCAKKYYSKKFDFRSSWTHSDSTIEVYALE